VSGRARADRERRGGRPLRRRNGAGGPAPRREAPPPPRAARPRPAAGRAEIWNEKRLLLATCAKGVPPYLKREIEAAGLPVLGERVAGIESEGTLADAMRLNLRLRTAQRVLLLLQSFEAVHPDALYREVNRFPWEQWLAPDGYFSVRVSVNTPAVRDERFAALRCKDAIADRLRARCWRRPDSGPAHDRFVVFLYWSERRCRVYLDSSGEPLSRRGYRRLPGKAPMQETLAAATILATRWDGRGHFVNPMCGSGTLAIEAALLALNRAPGLLRSNFGFMHVAGFPRAAWERLTREAEGEARTAPAGRILASDLDPQAVNTARENARAAGVERFIEFSAGDFADCVPPPGGGVVLMNPEYGQRLGETDALRALYPRIGDFFKQKCQGYTGYVFTGNLELAKTIGLRTSRRLTFFNGELECRLLQYDLYAGTRRRFGAPQAQDGEQQQAVLQGEDGRQGAGGDDHAAQPQARQERVQQKDVHPPARAPGRRQSQAREQGRDQGVATRRVRGRQP